MDIKTFTKVVPLLPPSRAILVRGPHGIGKSQLFRQIAAELGFTPEQFIDRRLSQMTEGDLLGLPELTGNVTKFAPPDWYMQACEKPMIILLDEFNRATPEVMQCGFQIVLDHELNGYKLHPQTRVYAAVNASPEYQVNEMDPALLDRFWTIDLEPTVEDWLSWANGRLNSVIVDFIRQHPVHLRHNSAAEPGKVYPSQRSWEHLDESLKSAKIDLEELAGTSSELLYPIALGFVGVEGAISLRDFVKNYESILKAEDVLDKWPEMKDRILKVTADKQNALIDKILLTTEGEANKDKVWTKQQADNLKGFLLSISAEMLVSFFNRLMATSHLENIKLVHQRVGMKVVEHIQAAQNLAKK